MSGEEVFKSNGQEFMAELVCRPKFDNEKATTGTTG